MMDKDCAWCESVEARLAMGREFCSYLAREAGQSAALLVFEGRFRFFSLKADLMTLIHRASPIISRTRLWTTGTSGE
jgi:hypothetical protein